MIKHYLKVAFRNLVKYKTQNLVSIIGLAVGFTCFALSVLWIRYEMTYDTFHKGAERIYMVRAHYTDTPEHISNSLNNPITSLPFFESKLPVGSSARINLGFATTARAMATRCC